MTRRSTLLDWLGTPTRAVVTGFVIADLMGTALLALPIASESGESAGWLTALFTSTSAVCVTGLAVVDTAGHWSAFGEVVILLLIQAGGLGIMTLGTLFTLLVADRLGLGSRLLVQAETKALSMADLRRLVGRVVRFTLVCELAIAVVLGLRFAAGYGEPLGRAAYLGVFHSISAFNNAGFALWPDSLMRFVTDPWICLPIAAAIIVGGLGFPVVFELLRVRRPARWTLLTRVTVLGTVTLLAAGTLILLATEWRNPATLGPLDSAGKLLAAFFAAVMPRTAGFNSLDVSQMYPSSWLVNDVLMFIGGGSAGTAGGIKVTTFVLIAFIIWAELRGEPRVDIGHRSVPAALQRQAVTIAILSLTLVSVSTYLLLVITPHGLDRVLFEAVSAFATVGLSTGITADLPIAGHLILILLMLVGRVGPLTLGTAMAFKERARRYELPEERMIVG